MREYAKIMIGKKKMLGNPPQDWDPLMIICPEPGALGVANPP